MVRLPPARSVMLMRAFQSRDASKWVQSACLMRSQETTSKAGSSSRRFESASAFPPSGNVAAPRRSRITNCPEALRMMPLAFGSIVCAVVNESPARNRIPSVRRVFMTGMAASTACHFFAEALAGLDSVLAGDLSAMLEAEADFAESESFLAACL